MFKIIDTVPGRDDVAPATGCAGCSRREFLSNSMVLAATALLAAACGDGQIGAGGSSTGGIVTGPTGSSGNTINLADYPALATVGGVARVTVQRTPIAIIRSTSTTYIALSLTCPHQGTTVSQVSGGFRCPNHGATFNSVGTWTGGQRTSSLSRINTTVDTTAGTLTVG